MKNNIFKRGGIITHDTLVGFYPICSVNYDEVCINQLKKFFKDTNSFILVEDEFDGESNLEDFLFVGGTLKIPIESYNILTNEYLNSILLKMTLDYDESELEELEEPDFDDYLTYIFQCRVQQYGGEINTDGYVLFEIESE